MTDSPGRIATRVVSKIEHSSRITARKYGSLVSEDHVVLPVFLKVNPTPTTSAGVAVAGTVALRKIASSNGVGVGIWVTVSEGVAVADSVAVADGEGVGD